MTLSCYCDYDWPEPGSVRWFWPNDYSTLQTKRSRKCCSCGERIEGGATVAAYTRYKVPEFEIELSIYGEGGDDGPPRATWYHCEECADLCFSLQELGFCLYIGDDMRSLVREYADTYGPKGNEERATTLPHDYARCGNDECELRRVCRRTEPGHPTHQSHSMFPGGQDCHGFIPQDWRGNET